jgi:hypothetical protein
MTGVMKTAIVARRLPSPLIPRSHSDSRSLPRARPHSLSFTRSLGPSDALSLARASASALPLFLSFSRVRIFIFILIPILVLNLSFSRCLSLSLSCRVIPSLSRARARSVDPKQDLAVGTQLGLGTRKDKADF